MGGRGLVLADAATSSGGPGAASRGGNSTATCNLTLFLMWNHTISVSGYGIPGPERRRRRKEAAEAKRRELEEADRKRKEALPPGSELMRLMANISVEFDAL